MRKVVYTVIVNNYDRLAHVTAWPGWDFVCFSDTVKPHGPWQVLPLRFMDTLQFSARGHLPFWITRSALIRAHEWLPDYDYSIYCDGNQTLVRDPEVLCAELNWPSFAAPRHYARDCIYTELRAIVAAGKAAQADADADRERYIAEGMPEHAGLYDCGVVFRAHHNPLTVAACRAWWSVLEEARVRRDQPALAFARWWYGFNVQTFEPDLRLSYFKERMHGA